MKDFLVIFVGATPKQNEWWWPSYEMCDAGISHDLVVVNRNMEGVPLDIRKKSPWIEEIFYENKIFSTFHSYDKFSTVQGNELAHKAFGAYRYYFHKYMMGYKYFAFVSDDVLLRRKNWLRDVYLMFEKYKGLGIVSPMVHNNPPHVRAPVWFGTREALSSLDWGFSDDHDGEMTIADRCVNAGFFVAQIGRKIDFAYDPLWERNANPRVCGAPQPNAYLEKYMFGEEHKIFEEDDFLLMEKFRDDLENGERYEEISSDELGTRVDMQRWNICLEFQPYHGLLYNRGIEIARKFGHDIEIWDHVVKSGQFDPDAGVLWGFSHSRYICTGIGPHNPIAILK
jgi:hypothetical protein